MPKTVTLTRPLSGGKVTSFTFREPRFEDYMLLGDPRAHIVADDKVYVRPIQEIVNGYAQRLLTDGDPAIMGFADLRDTLAIQETIMGFFRDAESKEPKEKTTSSGSDATSPL